MRKIYGELILPKGFVLCVDKELFSGERSSYENTLI